MTLEVLVKDLYELCFMVVAYADINEGILQKSVPAGLDIASHRNDHRVRVQLLCSVEHLSAFSVSDICYGACIDNIYVGNL